MLQTLKSHKLFVIIMLIISYWFFVRPALIRSSCVDEAKNLAHLTYISFLEDGGKGQYYRKDEIEQAKSKGTYLTPQYDSYYEQCLHAKGL